MSSNYVPKKSKVLRIINNTSHTESRITLQKMQDDSLRLDFRQFYNTKKDTKFKPTAKGTSIPATVENIDDLILALKRARKMVVKLEK